MKNGVKYFALTLSAFVLGMTINNFAISNVPSKIAVVDVNKVVASSSEIKKIKSAREAKIKELKTYIQTSQTNIQKETDTKKKAELEKNFTKELENKRSAINKDFSTKLTAIDKAISDIIAQKAKEANYDIVLTKGVVLYGGTDITAQITKSVK